MVSERRTVETLTAQLWQHSPLSTIRRHQEKQAYLKERLVAAVKNRHKDNHQRLLNASQTLHAVSPLATLNRGYALVTDIDSGQIIRSISQLKSGYTVTTRLAKGHFISKVNSLHNE